MKRKRIAAVIVLSTLIPTTAVAGHKAGHTRPQGPASIRFAPQFDPPIDSEWGFPIGGFGGTVPGQGVSRPPVIFVHGNNTDHGDWYPVRDSFRSAGWSDQELWGLSLNGLGSNYSHALLTPNEEALNERISMGWDGASRITSNDVNVADLYNFVLAVRAFTGSDRFSIVAHSLGVTIARKMLKEHRNLRGDLVAFVGIAGANHGTSFCPPGSEDLLNSCDEIAAGTDWLDQLNGVDGSDETYGSTAWLTIRDGSGVADPAFAGTYADSPMLLGATNLSFPGLYHNDLRLNPSVVSTYRLFVEEASA